MFISSHIYVILICRAFLLFLFVVSEHEFMAECNNNRESNVQFGEHEHRDLQSHTPAALSGVYYNHQMI